MLENFKEVVEALESTNEAVISHRLNDTFRVLTAISVIVLPLTLIASVFGMNTHVPGEQSDVGFWSVVVVMVVVLVGTIALFKRRGRL
jgi:magnesium transporter